MTHAAFFDTPLAIQRLRDASVVLMSDSNDSKRFMLGQVLRIISTNAPEFDLLCQTNIGWIGSKLLSDLEVIGELKDDKIDMVIASVYRFLIEFDLSISNELSMELRAFINRVVEITPSLSKGAQEQIEYARQSMPLNILKRILNSEEVGSLRNVSSVAYKMEQKINEWETKLGNAETNANRLSEILEKHTQAFNFVGLHEGFDDLSGHIKRELRFAQVGMGIFGLMVLIPGMIDIWVSLVSAVDLSRINVYTLIAASIGTVTLTLLFLYFFRIALRKADSCNAQLLQVRLRMSLCRFIQSYAEYANEIKEKNSDALTKFEALIFSGIVGTEDKLPSTFDGIEQLSALAKSIRGQG